jgi:hypothetical protein
MRDETALACVGIGALAFLEAVAIASQQDGAYLPLIVGAILALAGVAGARVVLHRENP